MGQDEEYEEDDFLDVDHEDRYESIYGDELEEW